MEIEEILAKAFDHGYMIGREHGIMGRFMSPFVPEDQDVYGAWLLGFEVSLDDVIEMA